MFRFFELFVRTSLQLLELAVQVLLVVIPLVVQGVMGLVRGVLVPAVKGLALLLSTGAAAAASYGRSARDRRSSGDSR